MRFSANLHSCNEIKTAKFPLMKARIPSKMFRNKTILFDRFFSMNSFLVAVITPPVLLLKIEVIKLSTTGLIRTSWTIVSAFEKFIFFLIFFWFIIIITSFCFL